MLHILIDVQHCFYYYEKRFIFALQSLCLHTYSESASLILAAKSAKFSKHGDKRMQITAFGYITDIRRRCGALFICVWALQSLAVDKRTGSALFFIIKAMRSR